MKELSEHEKLKAICDEIGYESQYKYMEWYEDQNINSYIEYEAIGYRILDVREIIFTQEFMETYRGYFLKEENIELYKKVHRSYDWNFFNDAVMDNLSNPVEYLYNLLDLGEI